MNRIILFQLVFLFTFRVMAQLPFADTLKDLDGKSITMDQLSTSGEPSMIYFWNMGCTPCILTFNYIKENEQEWKSKGFRMIAIAIQPYNEKMSSKIRAEQWPFDIYFHSNSKLLEDYQKQYLKKVTQVSYPQAFMFDADWNFFKFKSGGKVILKNEYKKDGWSDDLIFSQAMSNGEYFKLKTDLSEYYQIRKSLNK